MLKNLNSQFVNINIFYSFIIVKEIIGGITELSRPGF